MENGAGGLKSVHWTEKVVPRRTVGEGVTVIEATLGRPEMCVCVCVCVCVQCVCVQCAGVAH